jgi:hypothetical protein
VYPTTAETNDHKSFEQKELEYWSTQLGVTIAALCEAIDHVGLEVEAVARFLEEKKKT